MNSSITGKKFHTDKAAMWFAAVCIGAVLLWLCYGKPMQSRAIISLSNSVIVPTDQGTDAATANPENSQIVAVSEPLPLSTDIEDGLSEWRTVRMRVTAYCPCKVCCGSFAKGRTANGYNIRCGDRFAAAPKKYPFGTEIIVPQYNGEKPIKVIDRGGVIKGNRLD